MLLVLLADFDICFHFLDGFVQLFKVEEMGPGTTMVENFAVLANQVQALGRGSVGLVDGVVHLFH